MRSLNGSGAISTSSSGVSEREKVFVVIRINTAFSGRKRRNLMHGVLSLWLQSKNLKRSLKVKVKNTHGHKRIDVISNLLNRLNVRSQSPRFLSPV